MRYLLLIFAFVLFFVWIASFLIFHIVGGLIHLILVAALILFVVHLFSARRTV
jgi:Family of unknown function (DUF5670)